MRPEFFYTRNFYENAILGHYSGAEFDQKKIEELVTKYTELRLKDALLNAEFSKQVKSGNNGHIYLKVLREQIADELKLS
jgi:ribosomal protein L9